MEQSPANASPISQEISGSLLTTEVHYHVHNSPPLGPVLSQMNPIHDVFFLSLKVYFVIPTVAWISQEAIVCPLLYSI
jgi:hypothetical protein